MTRLLRAELLKLRTTRTFVGFVLAALGLTLLATVLTALLTTDPTEQDAREILTFDATSLFILLLGAIGMTGEWRHRTIASSFLSAPDRTRLLLAKLLAYAAAGVVLSLIVTLASAGVSSLLLALRDAPTAGLGDIADALWRNLVVAALLAAFGVAVGTVVRNQVGAMVGLLVGFFVVEPILIGVAEDVEPYMPFIGAPTAIIGQVGDAGFDPLSAGAGVLVLLGWIALFAIPGAWLLARRDLT
jgi:ABC-type transport system involved in multi-copper enzyme maturation permease subunit